LRNALHQTATDCSSWCANGIQFQCIVNLVISGPQSSKCNWTEWWSEEIVT
jgi:hypothetical protein